MRDAHQAALNCITADWSYKGDRFIGKHKGKVMQLSDLATNVEIGMKFPDGII